MFADITQKQLQRELEIRRREAEEANVRKTRFLAAVSHDIRTPANAISLLAELIRRPPATRHGRRGARAGGGAARQRESLVNLLGDVLDVARFDSDKIELQESEFPLAALVEDESRPTAPLARQQVARAATAPRAEPIWSGPTASSCRACSGTWSATRSSSPSRGRSASKPPAAEMAAESTRVTDTGVGIAPEHQGHIFDEFFQLRTPTHRTKGSGLGLTICKRLIDAMGGKLHVPTAPPTRAAASPSPSPPSPSYRMR